MIILDLLFQRISPIGLDIGHSFIKMIQLSNNNGEISVIAADQMPFECADDADDETRRGVVISTIKEMLLRTNFKGRQVISCLPYEALKITSLKLDISEYSNESDEMLEEEIANRLGPDVEDTETEYMVAGNVRHGDEIKKEVIVFTIKKKLIREHVGLFEELELELVGIDAMPCALFRSYERLLRRQVDQDVVNVFVDVGSWLTTVIISRGKDICLVKQIPIAGKHFNAEISSKLGIGLSEAGMLRAKLRNDNENSVDLRTGQLVLDAMKVVMDKLAKEISLCFRYYAVTFRGSRPEKAIFSGGETCEKVLIEMMERELSMDIETAQPLIGFETGRANLQGDVNGNLSEWAVAVGLGLKRLKVFTESNGVTEESAVTEKHRTADATEASAGAENNEGN